MNNWEQFFDSESKKPYYKNLAQFVNREYKEGVVYPPKDKIFNALKITPPEKVKCVILGQDPYHEPGQAMGLSFSVPEGIKTPPSLLNVYKELQQEFGYDIPHTGDLTAWAEQGVLLLNAILTVRAHEAASHRNKGWETFTDNVISYLAELDEPIVFMLWGNYARNKKTMIHNPKHLILESVHPSPLSAARGFFGCNHFKKCNEFLIKNGLEAIDWSKH